MKARLPLFLLWTLQGLVAFAWLMLLPGDADQGRFYGFSPSRLALFAIALALTAGSAALSWFSRRGLILIPPRFYNLLFIISVSAAVSAPAVIIILAALGKTSGFIYTAYAGRLAPLAMWFCLAGLETAACLYLGDRRDSEVSPNEKIAFRRTLMIVFLVLAALTTFLLLTGLGITRLNDGSWGGPATPLLEWQIILALLTVLVLAHLPPRLAAFCRWFQKDSRAFFAIYILTCIIWLSQPVNPGFFATPPRAPNFEIYPFSDAMIYAQYAQSALVGNGFMWPDVPTRPLYISFITWLHALAGQDYIRVIALQTLVLALFPPILYLLGKQLFGRQLGLGLAILAVLRDLTSNVAAPFALNYSYTKLFFSEIPTALLLSLFTLMALRWIRRPGPAWYPLLAGGLLGTGALIRLQSAVVLLAVIPLSFFIIKNKKIWAQGSAMLVLGVMLALTPWLVRNFIATGGLVLDNPISQSMVLARRWNGDNGNELIPFLPGEGSAAYSSRMAKLALAGLAADPGRILGSASRHFFNNEIDNLLVFPLRDQLDSPRELLWPEHAFWQRWAGQPTPAQAVLIAFYLFLFSFGITACWHKNRLLGLLPLLIGIVYNGWTALFLSSGDRFLIPADWSFYIYLFLGLLAIAGLLLRGKPATRLFERYEIEQTGQAHLPAAANSGRLFALVTAAIILLGLTLPLTEMLFPKKYPGLVAPSSTTGTSPAEITIHGRAIYPRWYKAGDGEPGSAKMGYGAIDKARLVFFLVGEQNTLVIYPSTLAPPFFPNAADVTITGKMGAGFLQAEKIVVQLDGKSAQYMP